MKTLSQLAALGMGLVLFVSACTAAPTKSPPSSTPGQSGEPGPIPVATTPAAIPSQTPTPAPPTPAQPTPTHTAVPTETRLPPAAGFPDPADYTWQLVVSGLERPLGLAHAGDGTGRLFVLEQPGRIRIIQEGVLHPEPFLDLRDRVGAGGNEQGLLGIAFHPNYVENGTFYLNYTDLAGDTVIARFQITSDPNRADASSEVRLLQVSQPYPNHNGGALAFGPDGYLYIGLGDGGSAGDPQGNGQSPDTLLGKILRLDVNSGDPYAIPPDNPYASGGGRPEIWAMGLRNPWRFAFDPQSGDLLIGDVGQNAWEEIDVLVAGSSGGVNFGWDYREGAHPYQGASPPGLALVDPIAEYSHSLGCSVTGGEVYRGAALPDWRGIYLYGDYCSGLIWGLLRNSQGAWENQGLFDLDANITSFGSDQDGEIYLIDRRGGVFRLTRR